MHTGSLPQKGSFVAIEQEGISQAFIVSAANRAESGKGWILRGYNTGGEKLELTLTPWRRFAAAAQVSLAEQKLANLAVDEVTGSVRLTARGHEIVTVLFQDK